MFQFVLLAALACIAVAEPSGYAASHNGYESDVNRVNAQRQLHVNHVAQHVGSGTGTARKDGVPGTPLGVTGHDRYSLGHGHGFGGYGNAGYGNAGYGNAGHGNAGYGNAGYGNVGYGNAGYGNAGHGNARHGNAGYGNAGYGNAGHGGYGNRGYGQGGYGRGFGAGYGSGKGHY